MQIAGIGATTSVVCYLPLFIRPTIFPRSHESCCFVMALVESELTVVLLLSD